MKSEMEELGNKPNIMRFVGALESMLEDNNALLAETRIYFENS